MMRAENGAVGGEVSPPDVPRRTRRTTPSCVTAGTSGIARCKLLDHLRAGVAVIVTKCNRLARSLKDLLEFLEDVNKRGAGFRSLAEDIDTTTPAGRLIFHVFASIAQFECERISERTVEGLRAARARGRVGGRPPALSALQREEVRRMRDEDGRSIAEIARLFSVSQQSVRRA